ncbi:MAG: PAS domain S-box protein [Azonexus sp.]
MPSSPTLPAAGSDPAERIRLLETENRQLRQQLEALADERTHPTQPRHSRNKMGLRSILDHLPAMVGYWDSNLRNCFSNNAYQMWFGLDPQVLPGKHIREVIGEERYRLNLPYIEGVLRGKPQQFEREIPRPDGKGVRHSLANYIPDIVDGEVCGFYVLVTETTALHDVQEALRTSEERYRAVIEDQTEMISRFTTDGRFTFVNNVYCRFFGKTAEEILGRAWRPICHPDDLALVEAQLATLSSAQPTVIIENRVFSGSGEAHWVQFINRGFFDDAGQLIEIQSVGRDITERKQAEEALLEAHNLMERHVVERTEQLRRLTIEKALAEDGERQAIARDLHDGLGQLLHVAKIRLDGVARQLPEGQAAAADELASVLAEASRQVRSLTTQLSPPVLHKLGLLHALHWLGEEMGRLYGLHVEVNSIGPWPQLAPAQASILFRSARELLINAAKHSGSKQARLAVMVTASQLILSVEDDGIGISNVPESLNTTHGFGLASIRERLTYLGGKTEIAGVPDAGLRITLSMPLTPHETVANP